MVGEIHRFDSIDFMKLRYKLHFSINGISFDYRNNLAARKNSMDFYAIKSRNQVSHCIGLDLGARTMIPMHWGCFDLTDEPVDLAPRELAEVLERKGADRERVRTLAVGERWQP